MKAGLEGEDPAEAVADDLAERKWRHGTGNADQQVGRAKEGAADQVGLYQPVDRVAFGVRTHEVVEDDLPELQAEDEDEKQVQWEQGSKVDRQVEWKGRVTNELTNICHKSSLAVLGELGIFKHLPRLVSHLD